MTPLKAGSYFNKIECFCFTEQVLAPGESVEMPVVFFIDPDIAKDPNLDDITEITLSYTFFLAGEDDSQDKQTSAASPQVTNIASARQLDSLAAVPETD